MRTIALLPACTIAILLGACTTPPSTDGVSARLGASGPGPRAALQAIRASQPDAAAEHAQEWLAQAPADGLAHLLLAAAHHRKGDTSSLALAATGYDAASQLRADPFWSRYLAGTVALRQHEAPAALRHFAAAVMAEPSSGLALEGLAAAAYAGGELHLARSAAEAALARDTGLASAWRTALLAAAGDGDRGAVQVLQLRASSAGAPEPLRRAAADDALARRALNLLATASVDQLRARPSEVSAAQAPVPDQVTVDAVLILSDQRDSRSYGVNLFDGLSLAFGATRSTAGVVGQGAQTAISRTLRIPDITYTLNIANRGARRYAVAARPSLTALAGQTSSFFVGEQLFVSVSGVNSAQLERVDVGVTLRVTPTEVRSDGARFRVEADRSFFSDQGVGSFREQLATFKQSVSATADVRFGQTLVLSGLVEQVRDTSDSRVPGLGDVPGPDLLFSRRTGVERQRSVMVLVTPSPPAAVARPPGALDGEARRLVELWEQIIEPRLGRGELLRRLQQSTRFTRGSAADVRARGLEDPAVLAEFLAHAQAEVDRSVHH